MNDKEKVLNAKIDEEIILNNDYIEKVRFEKEQIVNDPKYENGLYYIWVAYSKRQHRRTIFPMKDLTYVKFFKTLIGAKRNFIKGYLKEE